MSHNLSLLDSSNVVPVPEEFEGVLESPNLAICCTFNRRGTLLAVGCTDGRIVIWDFLTRGVAKCIPGHLGFPVCSLCWSRNGRKLVSAALDNTVAIWDILTNDCIFRLRFPSPILKSQLNPRNENFLLVTIIKHQSMMIAIDYAKGLIKQMLLPKESTEVDHNIVSTFDRRGQYIYSGNAAGKLIVVRAPKVGPSKEKNNQIDFTTEPSIISSFRIQTSTSNPTAIREIEFGARNKTTFLVNSADRTIRLYDCTNALAAGLNGYCEELRKFQDLVNKNMWRRCCLSGDSKGAYVCGGSARQHALYIWEADNGGIKKMLQGTRGELLLDVQWHPLRPIVASISSGIISIWARPQIENWSAFAPDFRELEENMEYEERESEFDVEDEDNLHETSKEADTDLSEVDVDTYQPDKELLSSDEEDLDTSYLEFIPIKIEDHVLDLDSSQSDSSGYVPPLKDEILTDPKYKFEIQLANPPLNESHPLSMCSSKRIRVNDKFGNARKVPKQT